MGSPVVVPAGVSHRSDMGREMIHTEKGRLDELIAVVERDQHFIRETLGTGPSGRKSRDKTLFADGPRVYKLLTRLKDIRDILAILKDAK